jgi:anti-sigma factor RsiW
MTDCIFRDRLVDLLSALDAPAAGILDHLVSCTECRAEVASLDRVREMIGTGDPLPAGFVDHIMHRIEASSAPAGAPDSLRPPVRPAISTALVALLSGVAASVVLLAAGTAAGPGVGLTPLSLLMGLAAGAGLTAYDLARPRDQVYDPIGIPQQRLW